MSDKTNSTQAKIVDMHKTRLLFNNEVQKNLSAVSQLIDTADNYNKLLADFENWTGGKDLKYDNFMPLMVELSALLLLLGVGYGFLKLQWHGALFLIPIGILLFGGFKSEVQLL